MPLVDFLSALAADVDALTEPDALHPYDGETTQKPTPQEAQKARLRALDRAAIDRMRYSQRRTGYGKAMTEDDYRQALNETRSRRLGCGSARFA